MIGEFQKRIRRWFRRHGWRTSNTPTGQGVYIESPVHHKSGCIMYDIETKERYVEEAKLEVELDRFNCGYCTLWICHRKHFLERDHSVPDNGFWHSHVLSDRFSDWETAGCVNVPAEDIIRLADLIRAAQEDWMDGRPSKNHRTFMERIADDCTPDWIGRNATYEGIKERYGNDRLRKARGVEDAFSWEPEKKGETENEG